MWRRRTDELSTAKGACETSDRGQLAVDRGGRESRERLLKKIRKEKRFVEAGNRTYAPVGRKPHQKEKLRSFIQRRGLNWEKAEIKMGFSLTP